VGSNDFINKGLIIKIMNDSVIYLSLQVIKLENI